MLVLQNTHERTRGRVLGTGMDVDLWRRFGLSDFETRVSAREDGGNIGTSGNPFQEGIFSLSFFRIPEYPTSSSSLPLPPPDLGPDDRG